ncbi:MAG: CBS domain-containing protein [Candidatus Nezhaarchaeales archaeon]
MRVSKYMSSPVVTAKLTDNLAHIRNLMLKYGISRVVIVDEALKPINIITKGDMIRVMISKEWRDKPLELICVSDVKEPTELKLATPQMTVKKAAQVMLKNLISGLPVISPVSGSLVGIITKTDLLKAFVDGYSGVYKVSDLMTKHPITVKRTHTIFRVQELLAKYNISRVIVVEDERPVGIITETDVVFARSAKPFLAKDKFIKQRIKDYKSREAVVRVYMVPIAEDVMTPNPYVVDVDEDASKAAALMLEHGISGLPVVHHDKLVGVITKTDIAKGVAGIVKR